MRGHAAFSLALLLSLAGVARAQESGSAVGGALGTTFERYSFGDPDQTGVDAISLLTVPFGARVRVTPGVALDVTGHYASGSLRRADGSTATLKGLTDTQLRLVLNVAPDLATVTAVALLPTGQDKLSIDEVDVAGIVAADLLPFAISNWGSGGGAGVAAALAHSFGTFGIGASGSYLVGRQYDLTTGPTVEYRPGNELRGRLALDAATGMTGKVSLQLTYLHSSEDQVAGSNLFRSGDRAQAMSSYSFAAGARASGIVYAGVLHRSHGTYLIPQAQEAASQNLFMAGGGLRLPVGTAVILPSADLRVVRRSTGLDQGTMTSVGATAEFRPGGGGLVLAPGARARFGKALVSEGSSSSFAGFEVSLAARFGGGIR